MKKHLGIEFYFFVSQRVMKDRGSICKFRNGLFRKFTSGFSVFHSIMRNTKVELNPYTFILYQNCSDFAMKYPSIKYNMAVFRTASGSYVTGMVSSKLFLSSE